MRTEKDKMLAGELYDPLDPELVRAPGRARDLLPGLNATRDDQQEERAGSSRTLFQPPGGTRSGCSRRSSATTAPTSCSASASSSTSTASCSTSARCTIGDFTLFGPAVQIYTATHPMNAERAPADAGVRQADRDRLRRVGRRRGDHLPGRPDRRRIRHRRGQRGDAGHPAGVFAAGNPCRVIREIR